MGVVLGPNRYGKAENRVVRIDRDTSRHVIHDLNVTTTLRGDFAAAYTHGDQSRVLPTDTQKNTVFAFAKSHGVDQIEDFALSLARHFVDDVEPVSGARIAVEEYGWERIDVDGAGHDHSFVRSTQGVRTTAVTVEELDANGDVDLDLFGDCGADPLSTSRTANNQEIVEWTNHSGQPAFFSWKVYLASDTRNTYSLTVSIR